jgi:hypothetical protein
LQNLADLAPTDRSVVSAEVSLSVNPLAAVARKSASRVIDCSPVSVSSTVAVCGMRVSCTFPYSSTLRSTVSR